LGDDARHALRELKGLSDGLLSSVALPSPAPAEAPTDESGQSAGFVTNTPRAGESEAQTAVRRERGKPAPGRARRTKEEIAEDEAADAADQANTTDSFSSIDAAVKQSISTGEERVDPANVEAQDKADEQAEVEQTRSEDKPLTVDDVKAVINQYVDKYGLPATQEDGPKIFVEALGAPPEGEPYWKLSLLGGASQDQLKKTVTIWTKAVELNPLKRTAV
jgi:hypothetical protein